MVVRRRSIKPWRVVMSVRSVTIVINTVVNFFLLIGQKKYVYLHFYYLY